VCVLCVLATWIWGELLLFNATAETAVVAHVGTGPRDCVCAHKFRNSIAEFCLGNYPLALVGRTRRESQRNAIDRRPQRRRVRRAVRVGGRREKIGTKLAIQDNLADRIAPFDSCASGETAAEKVLGQTLVIWRWW